MVMPAHGEHTEQINSQAQCTDKQQLASVHLWRVESRGSHQQSIISISRYRNLQPFDSLEDDENGDEDEKDPV